MTTPTADFDTIVVGGGPSGATAAHDLARLGLFGGSQDHPGHRFLLFFAASGRL